MVHHDEHDDDRPVGRVLGRREVMRSLGIGGATAMIAPGSFGRPWSRGALPACVACPEMDEGALSIGCEPLDWPKPW